ncbi:hypothetical protein [Longimicrobium sp.]|uniref:hypothetical protein n=1 Tax=Longimicrobium sp. TaxID=2029185 RepID=UPI002E324C08|nr:hypothetical protein [Longimicrobium sp.]HEX6042154.1 hypothetical protein [Longimicrobium sp.]
MASFELQITITGLNLILLHFDKTRAAILQPDCRDGVDPAHEDGSNGVPHVGFLSFDSIYLEPRSSEDVLRGEVVYRFDQDTLDLGLDNSGPVTVPEEFPFPDFSKFAPKLELLQDLLPPRKDTPLLLYSILESGNFIDNKGDTTRAIPQIFDSPPQIYEHPFPNAVTWTRTVDRDSLVISIRGFSKDLKSRFTLKPVEGIIRVTIANVCSNNPLAWAEYGDAEKAKDDQDFKWLYRLLQHPDGSFKQQLYGSPFPIPRLVHDSSSGVENCIGALLRGQTF